MPVLFLAGPLSFSFGLPLALSLETPRFQSHTPSFLSARHWRKRLLATFLYGEVMFHFLRVSSLRLSHHPLFFLPFSIPTPGFPQLLSLAVCWCHLVSDERPGCCPKAVVLKVCSQTSSISLTGYLVRSAESQAYLNPIESVWGLGPASVCTSPLKSENHCPHPLPL